MSFIKYVKATHGYNEVELGNDLDPTTMKKCIRIECYDTKEKIIAHMYRNPGTIDKMMWFLRGIIVPNGDLYVCDYEYSPKGTVIHVNMSEWLNENIPEYTCEYSGDDFPLPFLNEILTVQRIKNTNQFELSESYKEEDFTKGNIKLIAARKKKFEEYKAAFEAKNPRYELLFQFA